MKKCETPSQTTMKMPQISLDTALLTREIKAAVAKMKFDELEEVEAFLVGERGDSWDSAVGETKSEIFDSSDAFCDARGSTKDSTKDFSKEYETEKVLDELQHEKDVEQFSQESWSTNTEPEKGVNETPEKKSYETADDKMTERITKSLENKHSENSEESNNSVKDFESASVEEKIEEKSHDHSDDFYTEDEEREEW